MGDDQESQAEIQAFIQWVINEVEQRGFFPLDLKKIADHLFLEEHDFVPAVLTARRPDN